MTKIINTTVRVVEIDDIEEIHIEARFANGQKYSICKIDPEFDEFAHWLSNQINEGKVPCFAKDKS